MANQLMLLLLRREVERKRLLPGDAEGNPTRETMNREELIKDLKVISTLLEELAGRTEQKLKENRKIRGLLKLPRTVHNKARITNYIKNGTQ